MTPRENALLVYEHKIPESVPNFFTEFDIRDSFGERYFGPGVGNDWFGVSWTHLPELNAQIETPGQEVLETLEDWQDNIHFPDLDSYDWEKIAAETTKDFDRKNHMSGVMLLNGPTERLSALMGIENALCAYYETPDEVHEFFDAMVEHKKKYIEILKKYFNYDIIIFHDDWGSAKNMTISKPMWDEFVKPTLQPVIDKTHELNMYFEMHSCGYIAPVVGDLVEMGIDALNPLQYSNDVPALKALYGDRIVFSGGFDSLGILERPGATEEEIRMEVRRCIDALAPGGNYATLCPIIDKRVAGIVADEITRYGKNYYLK